MRGRSASRARNIRLKKKDAATRVDERRLSYSYIQFRINRPSANDVHGPRQETHCDHRLLGIFGAIVGKESLPPQFLKLCSRSYFQLQVTFFGQLFECLQEFSAILRRWRQFRLSFVERHRTILHMAVCTQADHPESVVP